MRRIFLIVPAVLLSLCSLAQTKKKSFNLANRASDHFVVQLSADKLLGMPDSIDSHIKGLSRGLNIYAMLDKPFKSNPKLSIALGVGIGSALVAGVVGTSLGLIAAYVGGKTGKQTLLELQHVGG